MGQAAWRRLEGLVKIRARRQAWISWCVVTRLFPSSGRLWSVGSPWLVAAVVACGSSTLVLSRGSVSVTFTTDETCGFENPHVAEAKGCRVIDREALMCKGFGVIDGVLFAGGCEAPAEARVLETRGTLPIAPAPLEEDDAPAADGPAPDEL